ncbi:aldolase catalytic domain-containing protein [Flavobacteriaceae bacterium]|nr:aldolase catalytic domain-containing protein [Flavobacteriaceae bacterium]
MKILDCTIRDGGYYTNWDFDKKLITEYCNSMEKLPIDYVEVGYRSIPLEGYLGKYFYCPIYVLEELKKIMPSKKLVIILNEKDIRPEHLEDLLLPIKPYVTLIRMAVDPKNFERAIKLAKATKSLGFEVAFNVMYMSNWKKDPSFLNLLEGLDETLDYFYMVDSFGGILPNEVKEIVKLVKSKTNVSLGFHGHDNLHMGLINSIIALEEGCEIIDATITGMGRGAGNLKTELLLSYLESQEKIKFDFNMLGNAVAGFEDLKKIYNWGTSLPYIFSGANSLPQKEVMDWVGMNRYSLNSILNALNNKKLIVADNIKLPVLKKTKSFNRAIILGGGRTVRTYKDAIIKYVDEDKDICLIHAGVKNVSSFNNVSCKQFYSLLGIENDSFLTDVINTNEFSNVFLLPPYPRKMGVSLSVPIQKIAKELECIEFTNYVKDSPIAVALQAALDLGVDEILLIGFDGYDVDLNKNQFVLAQENQNVINDILKVDNISVKTLSPTKYENIQLTSIYSLIK